MVLHTTRTYLKADFVIWNSCYFEIFSLSPQWDFKITYFSGMEAKYFVFSIQYSNCQYLIFKHQYSCDQYYSIFNIQTSIFPGIFNIQFSGKIFFFYSSTFIHIQIKFSNIKTKFSNIQSNLNSEFNIHYSLFRFLFNCISVS